MNKVRRILWGVVLVAIGVLLVLNTLGIIKFDPFFRGFGTLFIIIPCGIGLITDRNKIGSLIGLTVGVALLLAARDVITYDLIWKLCLPFAIIFIGLAVIFKTFGKREAREVEKKLRENGTRLEEYCATFTGMNVDFASKEFTGVSASAIFGGIKLDLRAASINSDSVIKVASIFGGADILLPDDVNVKLSSSSVFGGVSNKRKQKNIEGAHTVYISANCIFGGCDIK